MRIDQYKSDQYLNTDYSKQSIPSTGNVGSVRSDFSQKQNKANEQVPGSENETKPDQKVKRANASLGNVSVTLGNRDQSLVGLGNLGGIQSNVMRKAVSDMKKDSVLHEYQYFVGNGVQSGVSSRINSSNGIITNDEDGVVIQKK